MSPRSSARIQSEALLAIQEVKRTQICIAGGPVLEGEVDSVDNFLTNLARDHGPRGKDIA